MQECKHPMRSTIPTYNFYPVPKNISSLPGKSVMQLEFDGQQISILFDVPWARGGRLALLGSAVSTVGAGIRRLADRFS